MKGRELTLEEQTEVLKSAESGGGHLSDLLHGKGLTYDSLRYVEESPDNVSFPTLETLDHICAANDNIPAVSFFSGAGGLNIGFQYAGFNNFISVEFNETFCNTLRANSPDKIVIGPPDYEGDVSKREELSEILAAKGVGVPFDGVFHGGPPCQSFSIAANQRFNKDGVNFKRKGFDDEERGNLIFDYIWFIKKFRPRAFFIENVAGIMDCDCDGRIAKALEELVAQGYALTGPQVVNAAFYGVPQNRQRWIVMGIRDGGPIAAPQPNAGSSPCGAVFLRDLEGVENHLTREHSAQSVKRYMNVKFGGRDKLGRVDRLDPCLPSKTVIAGGTKGGGRSHLHPFIPRTLSVRECARLQTFPDSYVFTGSTARQFTQVGNAVPPLLAYKFALSIKKALNGMM
ncbi:MAG: DNA cytosine methyltransferase [Bacteroidales bacterium]|nr:DNA cytosine methyltransferase [Bacteroidales bacterium]